ncbi:hypothetical protein [Microbacterium sp. gxy059]|uniref:hypothetical protein n=1 Tax=Microbacterium sp. gxy059 TaxID=2957199 RepID=UPI003D998E44
MPVLLIGLAIIIVVFVLRLVVGLFTRPVETIQMLGTWVCNLVGIVSAAVFVFLLVSVFVDGEADLEMISLLAATGVVAVVAFALSAWLRRRRLQGAYRKHIEAEYAARAAVERRRGGRL